MIFNCGNGDKGKPIIKDLLHEILEGSFKDRIYCFTAFKETKLTIKSIINITKEVKIQVWQNDDTCYYIRCRIFTENENSEVEITKEDLLTINDIILFLKTKAEESLKQWEIQYAEAKK